jgi:hypothetical protein
MTADFTDNTDTISSSRVDMIIREFRGLFLLSPGRNSAQRDNLAMNSNVNYLA